MSNTVDLTITPPHNEDWIGSFSAEEIHLFRNGKKRGNVEIEVNGAETSAKWLPDSEIGTSSFFIESVREHSPDFLLSVWCTKEAGRLVRPRDVVSADGFEIRILRALDANHFEGRPLIDDLRLRARVLQIVDTRETDADLRRLVELTLRRLDAKHQLKTEWP